MIEFRNGGILLEDGDPLPIIYAKRIYADYETSSGDPAIKSLNPWDTEHCKVAGLAITYDDCPTAWYIPRRLIDVEWLQSVFDNADEWCNHNIKYDLHVGENDLGIVYRKRLIDSLTYAKILDSDRTYKGGYSLEALALAFLNRDVSGYRLAMEPWLKDNHDYGAVPDDIIGEYACQDVFDVRDVVHYIDEHLPDQCKDIWKIEQDFTSVLAGIERRGLRIEPTMVKVRMIRALERMLEIEGELEQLTGRSVNPTSNADCFDLLCNQYGLPVIAWTKENKDGKTNPSFTKDALREYSSRVDAPRDVVNLMLEYRKLSTLQSLFYASWLGKHVDGVLHSDYNQCVRSGRTSCKNPNSQQFNKEAKKSILPREGYSLVEIDYSQIEYRLIIHYINNRRTIEQYAKDARTDYHVWVANLCGIARRPAKTVNFMFGYGGGKKRGIKTLSTMIDIVSEHMTVHEMERMGERIYNTYHRSLPELKPTTRLAGAVAERRGYVFNAHGRHLHLPSSRAHVGFNRIVQSDASDIMKERAKHVSPEFNPELREWDVHLLAIVHDSCLFEIPTHDVDRVAPILRRRMEEMTIEYRVPVMADVAVSDKSWGDVQEREDLLCQ